MIELTGLWVNAKKDGGKYMVGYLNNQRILIFKNDFKTEEKHPDYRLLIAPQQEKQEATDLEGTADFTEADFVPI